MTWTADANEEAEFRPPPRQPTGIGHDDLPGASNVAAGYDLDDWTGFEADDHTTDDTQTPWWWKETSTTGSSSGISGENGAAGAASISPTLLISREAAMWGEHLAYTSLVAGAEEEGYLMSSSCGSSSGSCIDADDGGLEPWASPSSSSHSTLSLPSSESCLDEWCQGFNLILGQLVTKVLSVLATLGWRIWAVICVACGTDEEEPTSSMDYEHFLQSCFFCKASLAERHRDIFMYRGNIPFCSSKCREAQILADGEAAEVEESS